MTGCRRGAAQSACMTARAAMVALCAGCVVSLLLAATTVWAAITTGVVGAVYVGGPLAAAVTITVIAWTVRREIRATWCRDLAEANDREEQIARR